MTVSNDGTRLFVGNGSSTFLSVLDLTSPLAPVALAPITLPGNSERATENPAGTALYVSTNNTSVFVVDLATATVSATWSGLNDPHQVTISADGTHGFVSQQLGATTPIFDLATNTASGSIPLANSYYQSVDPSQGAGFITLPFTASGSVGIIDTTTGALTQTLPGVTGAYYTATDPTTHLTFVTSVANNAFLTVIAPAPAPPVVTTNPINQIVNLGQTATFTAAATSAEPETVQWQVSTDLGLTFADIPGATSDTFTTGATVLADNDTQYRAVFTNSVGSATTFPARLTVLPVLPPVVTTNPVDQTVTEGKTAMFTAAASVPVPTSVPTPAATLTVQWQVSTDSGATFTDIPGATTSTLTIGSAALTQNGTLYRAVFTNPAGSATTTAATLTVTPAAGPTPPPPSEGPSVNTGGVTGGPSNPALAASLIALGVLGLAVLAIFFRRRRA